MNTLVIPDTHLKPWIFDAADKIIETQHPDAVVVLGDLVDDWRKQSDVNLYETHLKRAIRFANVHKNIAVIWLRGNHEIPYLVQGVNCPGHSDIAEPIVREYLNKLDIVAGGMRNLLVIDNVMFSHAGYVPDVDGWYKREDKTEELKLIEEKENSKSFSDLWDNYSTVWYRPQDTYLPYDRHGIMQIVGHTPRRKITAWRNMLITDVFSTALFGEAIGTEQFIIVDTVSLEIRVFSKDGKEQSADEIYRER